MVCADRGIPPDGTKGAAVHLRSLVGALTSLGHHVLTFSARRPERAGIFPGPVLPLTALAAAVAQAPPDVIHERYSLGHAGGLETARRAGVPFALEVNAPLVLEALRHRPDTVTEADDAAERRLFADADLVVAVSEPLRRHVARVRGSDHGTHVLWNGVDPSLYPRPAPLDGPPVVAFLGHPRPWHGAEALPELLADLHRRNVPARLLLIGGGPGADRVREAAAARGLGRSVEITGGLDHGAAADRLLGSTVSIAPYPPTDFFYFCPLKVMESMAAGVPVVTTDQGDLPAIVGKAGTLVPATDPVAMADAVAALLQDRPRARRLGARAREHALGRFTWERVAGELVRHVRAVAGDAAA